MTKRRWIIAGLIVSLGGLAFFLYYRHRTADADPYEDFSAWPPSAATIRQKLAVSETPTPEQEAARRDQFAQMFQSRFRNHEPMYAIGLKFRKDGDKDLLKLMCPARMEPWNIDRIAYAAWKESQEVFGKTFDLHIYETYIGTPPIKIGELRPDPKNPQAVQIVYLPPARVRGQGAVVNRDLRPDSSRLPAGRRLPSAAPLGSEAAPRPDPPGH
jgi:hypothetical protein